MRASLIHSRSRPQLPAFFRNCRCYTCLANPEHAIALRRPTTLSKSRPWQKLTTLFYSSLFATAAAFDAEAKQQRKQQWEHAIAAAEADLHHQHQQNPVNQSTIEDKLYNFGEKLRYVGNDLEKFRYVGNDAKKNMEKEPTRRVGDDPNNVDTADSNEPYNTEEPIKSVSSERFLDNAPVLEKLRTAMRNYGVSEQSIPPGLLGRSHGPESVYAEEGRWSTPLRWTPKKLVTLELAVAKLALELSDGIQGVESTSSVTGLPDLNRMRVEVHTKLGRIQKQDQLELDGDLRVGLPRYIPSADRQDPLAGYNDLNRAIFALTQQNARGELPLTQTLARISQYLLGVKSPPDVSTMTLLLNHFSEHGHARFADAVIQCMFFEGKMRLNEPAVESILKHHLRNNNSEEFRIFSLKMRGYYRGLARVSCKRPGHRFSRDRIRVWKGKTYQSIENDEPVWNTLVEGHLHFGQTFLGLRTFFKMAEAGISPNISSLVAVLGAVADHGYWPDGRRIWHMIGLEKLPEGLPTHDSEYRCRAYHHMLRLCKARGKHKEYALLYKKATNHGFSDESLNSDKLVLREPLSPETNRLTMFVQIVSRKAHLQDIAFQLRARAAIKSQMIVAGHKPNLVDYLFKVIEWQAKRTAMIEAWRTSSQYMTYGGQLFTARRLFNHHIRKIYQRDPNDREVIGETEQKLMDAENTRRLGDESSQSSDEDTALSHIEEEYVSVPATAERWRSHAKYQIPQGLHQPANISSPRSDLRLDLSLPVSSGSLVAVPS